MNVFPSFWSIGIFSNECFSSICDSGFLTIGIPSIKRITGTEYVTKTISSLAEHTTSSEKLETVVIVFLADFDRAYNERALEKLKDKFRDLISIGFLQIIQATKDYYPDFDHLKHNFKDKDDRVRWRSKQVMDFAFLFMYAQNQSQYYLQLEDDVISADNYIPSIKSYIAYQNKPWVMLEFSELGFIGKLFKTKDLPKLAKFMLTLFEEQPIDWLLRYFRLALTQDDILMRKPTLFQHIGLKSSFDITSDNKLKDRFFDNGEKKWRGDDPPAKVYTVMQMFDHYHPDLCYASGSGYFWAKEPQKGDDITVRFDSPQRVKRIVVETGNGAHPKDILHSGILETSPRFLRYMKRGNVSAVLCADWKTVAKFEEGKADTGELSTWNKPVHCMRVTQTEQQESWVVYQQIAVFIYT